MNLFVLLKVYWIFYEEEVCIFVIFKLDDNVKIKVKNCMCLVYWVYILRINELFICNKCNGVIIIKFCLIWGICFFLRLNCFSFVILERDRLYFIKVLWENVFVLSYFGGMCKFLIYILVLVDGI